MPEESSALEERIFANEEKIERLEERNDRLEKIIRSNEDGKKSGMAKDVKDIKKILLRADGMLVLVKAIAWLLFLMAGIKNHFGHIKKFFHS